MRGPKPRAMKTAALQTVYVLGREGASAEPKMPIPETQPIKTATPEGGDGSTRGLVHSPLLEAFLGREEAELAQERILENQQKAVARDPYGYD